MTESPEPRSDQENFGEASLGEAQSENPPADPEYLEDTPEGDQDSEPARTPDEADRGAERDQAEG